MRYRIGFMIAFLTCVTGLQAQQAPPELYVVDLVLGAQAVALDKPVLQGDVYVFHAWPEGALVRVKQANVRRIVQKTGLALQETVYQIDLIPSGQMLARDNPTLKGTNYVFHTLRAGTLMSVRQADVRKITRMTGERAFTAEQTMDGTVAIGNLAFANNTQAGPQNLSQVATTGSGGVQNRGTGFYSNVVPGQTQGMPNSANDNVVGRTWAYAPSSATQSSPGAPPTNSSATSGQNPPTMSNPPQ